MFGLWWIFIGLIVVGVIVLMINIIVNTIINRKKGWSSVYPNEWEWGWATLIICGIVSLCIFLPLCIFEPKKAHEKVIKYKYDYEMVQEVVLNGKDLENIKITETILNYNNWLSKAKADKETWGNWSVYYKEDLDSLKPIVIVRNNNG